MRAMIWNMSGLFTIMHCILLKRKVKWTKSKILQKCILKIVFKAEN